MAGTQNKNTQQATPETVWALLQEVAASQKDTDRQIKELTQSQKELTQSQKETDRQMKQLRQEIGGMAHNQGSFAEEYFFSAFDSGKRNFFGERFDSITKQLKGHWEGENDEYDIVMFNHESVAIVEVKYSANEGDIAQVKKKAGTFRVMFPGYAGFKIYLGLASMSFPEKLERKCTDEGIAAIKQVGDAVVVNDANLRVF